MEKKDTFIILRVTEHFKKKIIRKAKEIDKNVSNFVRDILADLIK